MTHCKRGHPFTGANLYLWNGRRYCRACRAADATTRPRKPKPRVVNPQRPGPKPRPIADRLREHSVRREDGCLIWQGPPNNSGYGSFKSLGKRAPVHRVAYTTWVGPIPPGLQIDHLCRTRLCIEPTHLEAVTPRVNVHRSDSPSMRAARRSTCKAGHRWKPETTYYTRDGSRKCRICHREYMRARYVPREPKRRKAA